MRRIQPHSLNRAKHTELCQTLLDAQRLVRSMHLVELSMPWSIGGNVGMERCCEFPHQDASNSSLFIEKIMARSLSS
jgi:hypothetical protein